MSCPKCGKQREGTVGQVRGPESQMGHNLEPLKEIQMPVEGSLRQQKGWHCGLFMAASTQLTQKHLLCSLSTSALWAAGSPLFVPVPHVDIPSPAHVLLMPTPSLSQSWPSRLVRHLTLRSSCCLSGFFLLAYSLASICIHL